MVSKHKTLLALSFAILTINKYGERDIALPKQNSLDYVRCLKGMTPHWYIKISHSNMQKPWAAKWTATQFSIFAAYLINMNIYHLQSSELVNQSRLETCPSRGGKCPFKRTATFRNRCWRLIWWKYRLSRISCIDSLRRLSSFIETWRYLKSGL